MARAKAEEGKISKRKMVETALEKLGNVGPKEIGQYILENYKEEINPQMISSYKSQILSKKGGGGTRKSSGGGGGSLGVHDIATVKDLLSRLGEPQLLGLIKALS